MSLPIAVLDQIAPGGRMRLAANMANAAIVREHQPGQFSGPVAELANRLASLLNIEVVIRPFASGGAILASPHEWDAAVLAVDPTREQICYVHEVARVSATIAGRLTDPASSCAEADRPGARIATARGAAYENYLLRNLRYAQAVSFDTPGAAREALLRGECDFVAGIRTSLEDNLTTSVRLMSDDFQCVTQSLALPVKHKEAAILLSQLLGEGTSTVPL